MLTVDIRTLDKLNRVKTHKIPCLISEVNNFWQPKLPRIISQYFLYNQRQLLPSLGELTEQRLRLVLTLRLSPFHQHILKMKFIKMNTRHNCTARDFASSSASQDKLWLILNRRVTPGPACRRRWTASRQCTQWAMTTVLALGFSHLNGKYLLLLCQTRKGIFPLLFRW